MHNAGYAKKVVRFSIPGTDCETEAVLDFLAVSPHKPGGYIMLSFTFGQVHGYHGCALGLLVGGAIQVPQLQLPS